MSMLPPNARSGIGSVLCLGVITGSAGSAQERPHPRITTTVVEIDAVVADKNGLAAITGDTRVLRKTVENLRHNVMSTASAPIDIATAIYHFDDEGINMNGPAPGSSA